MARIVGGPYVSGRVTAKQTGTPISGVTVTVSPAVYTTAEMTSSTTTLTTNGDGVFVCYALPGTYTFTTTAVDAAPIEPVEILGAEGLGADRSSSTVFPLLTSLPVNVKDPAYGAVGDGVADDTAALQAAINAAHARGVSGTSGGQVLLPPGIYMVSAELVVYGNMRIQGAGTISGSGQSAVIKATAASTQTRIINATNINNLAIKGLGLQYACTGVNGGVVIDCTGSNQVSIEECGIAGSATSTKNWTGVLLSTFNYGYLSRNSYTRLADCVVGCATNATFSNVVTLTGELFGNSTNSVSYSGYAIKNPHESWTVINCNFEPNTSGAPAALGFTDTSFPCQAVEFLGCWTGDLASAYAGTEAWLNYRGANLQGLRVVGGYFGLTQNTHAVAFGDGAKGLYVNTTFQAINGSASPAAAILLSGACTNVDISPACVWSGCSVPGISYANAFAATRPYRISDGSGKGPGSPGEILVYTLYAPKPSVSVSATGSDADIDGTNLAFTFTAPPSGNILVRASVYGVVNVGASGTTSLYLMLRTGGATVAGTRNRVLGSTSLNLTVAQRVSYSTIVTGLTPGTAYTYTLAQTLSGNGSASVNYGYTNPEAVTDLGPALITVQAV